MIFLGLEWNGRFKSVKNSNGYVYPFVSIPAFEHSQLTKPYRWVLRFGVNFSPTPATL
jgi:hypothetical protein